MAITKPQIVIPFATDVSDGADPDLFNPPSYMSQGFPAPGGDPVVPPLGYFNWLLWYDMLGVRYHNSRGLPEWDANETEYTAGSVVYYSGAYYHLVGTATPATNPTADPSNWVPHASGESPDFGDGSFSQAPITGTVHRTESANLNFGDLEIGASGILYVDKPVIIRVSGTLKIANGGKIKFGDPAVMDGVSAVGGPDGAGGVGGNASNTGTLLGGSSGGGGGSGIAGDPITGIGFGGAGGAGESSGGAGGAGGALTPPASLLNNMDLYRMIINGGWGMIRGGTSTARTMVPFYIQGGSGGGSGGASGTSSGGGAGGAVGLVIARRLVTEADGCIMAAGGIGGAAGPSVTSGGGGGGGFIGIVCGSYSGPSLGATACCPGGSSPGGVAGGNGRLFHAVVG